MFNGKIIDFDEWIAQIEEVSNLTVKPEYVLSLAKSSCTPYKMISQTPRKTAWSEIKGKLQEVYFLVATHVHAATDLLKNIMPMNHLKITLLTGLRCATKA